MLDFERFAAKYHIPHLSGGGHHHSRPGWVQTHCPFCAGGRGGWHLGFSLTEGTWNCWRCGRLRHYDVLAALTRVRDPAALQDMAAPFQRAAVLLPRLGRVRKKNLAPPPGTGELLPAHRKYLENRRYDPDALAAEWGVRGVGPASAPGWAWRILIPIHDAAGTRAVAYQGRAIGDAKPKYKMTPDADCLEDPDGLVYGLHRVPGDGVIIMEGVPSVWRMGPGAVATFGIDWKRPQINRLRRFKRRFILFDPEPYAQKRAMGLARALALFPGETEVVTGFARDPGDFSDARAARVRRELLGEENS